MPCTTHTRTIPLTGTSTADYIKQLETQNAAYREQVNILKGLMNSLLVDNVAPVAVGMKRTLEAMSDTGSSSSKAPPSLRCRVDAESVANLPPPPPREMPPPPPPPMPRPSTAPPAPSSNPDKVFTKASPRDPRRQEFTKATPRDPRLQHPRARGTVAMAEHAIPYEEMFIGEGIKSPSYPPDVIRCMLEPQVRSNEGRTIIARSVLWTEG